MKRWFPIIALSFLVLVSACSSPGDKPNEVVVPPGLFRDTTVLPSPGEVHTSKDTAQNGAQAETFRQRSDRMEAAVFGGEFKSTDLGDMEDSPKFKQAREMIFHKQIRLTPIKNSHAGKIIPRILWKSYHFPTYAALQKNMEDWLNSTEHSGAPIVLGNPVDAVKLPPIVCGVFETEVYMMQTSCIYEGPELEALVKRFWEQMKNEKAKYRFRIGCNAGKMVYITE